MQLLWQSIQKNLFLKVGEIWIRAQFYGSYLI